MRTLVVHAHQQLLVHDGGAAALRTAPLSPCRTVADAWLCRIVVLAVTVLGVVEFAVGVLPAGAAP